MRRHSQKRRPPPWRALFGALQFKRETILLLCDLCDRDTAIALNGATIELSFEHLKHEVALFENG